MLQIVGWLLLGGLITASPQMEGQIRGPMGAPNPTLSRTQFQKTLPTSTPAPFWKALEALNPEEQRNARIQLEGPKALSPQAQGLMHQVETLWNQGQYSRALKAARELARFVDPTRIAVGIAWREPRAVSLRWGTDVLVSDHDHVHDVNLLWYNNLGHLFAVIAYLDTSNNFYRWTLNLSVDGGETWQETYDWFQTPNPMAVDIATMQDTVYVAYNAEGDLTSARIRRFDPETGGVLESWTEAFDDNVPIAELVLFDNSGYLNNRLYYTAILEDGTLKFLWTSNGQIFHEISTGVTDASRGLDATFVDEYTGTPPVAIYLSYINTSDQWYVGRFTSSGTYEDLGALDNVGSSALFTDIAVHRDTVLTASEYEGSAAMWIKYWIRYGEGNSWLWGSLGTDTLTEHYLPALVGDHNNGFAAVYWNENHHLFRSRSYHTPNWTDPVQVSDFFADPFRKPDMTWIAPDIYGVAYISSEGRVFFDRTDWVEVAEDTRPSRPFGFRVQTASGVPWLSFTLPQDLQLTLEVYNATGARVFQQQGTWTRGTHQVRVPDLAAGVYLARLKTPHQTVSTRFVVVR